MSDPTTGKVYGADDEIAGGTPIWMQRLFGGGALGGGVAAHRGAGG